MPGEISSPVKLLACLLAVLTISCTVTVWQMCWEPRWGTTHIHLQLAPELSQLLTVAGDQSLGQREMEKAELHKLRGNN